MMFIIQSSARQVDALTLHSFFQVHVALSESYPEFVRSGLISVVPGRVTALEAAETGDTVARVRKDDGEIVLEVSWFPPTRSTQRQCGILTPDRT